MQDVNTMITLLKTSNQYDMYGNLIDDTTTETQVYATLKSVKYSEFYAAKSAGIQADIVAIIRYCDYDSQKQCIIDNQKYRVIRTYRTDKDRIELTLTCIDEGVSNNANDSIQC